MMYKGRRFKSVTALREYYGLSKMLYYFRRSAGHVSTAGKYYRSHSAMDRALRLNRKSGEALREDHEMSVCRTKVADYYHLDGLEDPRLEGELVKDFIAEAKGQIKYRFSVRDVFGDRLERMAVLYAKDKAPKLTVQDDIYDLHLDMARVYLPDIENAEVESYNHAD